MGKIMKKEQPLVKTDTLHLPSLWSISDDSSIEALVNLYRDPNQFLARLQAEHEGNDFDRETSVVSKKKIAVVPLVGEIVSGIPPKFEEMGWGVSPERFASEIRTVGADEEISEVLIFANTPGGTVAGSHEAFEAVKELAEIKAVTTYTTQLCSAGYWICAPSHQIIGSAAGPYGSIGIVKALVGPGGEQEFKVIRSGPEKMLGASGEKITDKVEEVVQQEVNDVADVFWNDISSVRTGLTSRTDALRKGGVFIGQKAIDIGLVDSLANSIQEVIENIASASSRGGMSASRTKGKHMPNEENGKTPPEEGTVSLTPEQLQAIKDKARNEGLIQGMNQASSASGQQGPSDDSIQKELIAQSAKIQQLEKENKRIARENIANQAMSSASDINFPPSESMNHKEVLLSKVLSASHGAETNEAAIEAAKAEVEQMRALIASLTPKPEANQNWWNSSSRASASESLRSSVEPSPQPAQPTQAQTFFSEGLGF